MSAFTIARWVFTFLYLLNLKSSLLAWHARFVYLVIKHTLKFKTSASGALSRQNSNLPDKDIWTPRKYRSRATMGL